MTTHKHKEMAEIVHTCTDVNILQPNQEKQTAYLSTYPIMRI